MTDKLTDTQIDGCMEHTLPLAGPSDQVHVQRATASCIVPVRSLGQGAFAQVDLCHVAAGPSRKLLVRKMLVSGSSDDQISSRLRSSGLIPVLKPSTACDWTREASMHRECAGCPFVLQLLAAKRCRSGKLLLLLEYAALGSLTDILATRRQQIQQQQDMPMVQESTISSAETQTCASRPGDSGAVVDTLLPLALSAVELLAEDERGDEQVLEAAEAVFVKDHVQQAGNFQAEKRQQQAECDYADSDAPVFVAFMPELLAEVEAADVVVQQRRQDFDQQPRQQSKAFGGAAAEGMPTTTTAAAAAVNTARALSPAAHDHHGLPEATAKFFAGCILMALQWMHSKRILHRDIKPCNLLLFGDGYLKLADLGCCCQLPPGIEAAETRTGTAAYMAPEVISQTPYSYPVDMWSLGVTIWQMVAGCLPEWAEERQEQQDQQGQRQQQQQVWWDGHPEPPEPLLFPPHFSQELCCLLSGMLHHDSAARLKLDDVMATDWFAGFDWQALRDKTLTPPSLP